MLKIGARYCLIAVLFCVAHVSPAQELVEKWSVKNVFMMPESAALDIKQQQIYISNVNGYAKDANGFVSKVSADGKNIELKWLAGLNSPTGMVVFDGRLYIADYDELVIVEIESKKIVARIPAPDEKPGLNDVAISSEGRVFVSGSASSRIYELDEDRLLIWKYDKQRLKNANGLLVEGDHLIHGGLHWSIFNMDTRRLIDGFKTPNPAVSDIDGITAYCGGYIVSLIEDPRLWRIDTKANSRPLSELAVDAIDIQYHQGQLYAPTVGGGLSVFELPEKGCIE